MAPRRALWRAGLDVHSREHLIPTIRRVAALPAGLDPPLHSTFHVPVESCTSFAALPFGSDGWNPLVATLRAFDDDAHLSYEDSPLALQHQSFQPATLGELLLDEPTPTGHVLASYAPARRIFRYVWLTTPEALRSVDPDSRSTSYYFGPTDAARGQAEFDRLVSVHRSIRRSGYDPEKGSPVTGYFVTDGTDARFVIGGGNHRVASLAASGEEYIEVRLHSHPAVVHRDDLSRWTVDKGGAFTADEVEALHNAFLHGDGWSRSPTRPG